MRVALACGPLVALLAFAVPLAATQPAVDTVAVSLTASAVIVDLEVPPVDGVVEAYALFQPGQALDIISVTNASGPVEFTVIDDESVARLAVPSSSGVRVRYRVTGDAERVPLFVPGGGAVVTVARAVDAPYLVRLTGAPELIADVDPETSMPRMSRAPDGSLEVRLSSVPSLVRISRGGPFSFARMADAFALFLVLFGAVVIFRRLKAA